MYGIIYKVTSPEGLVYIGQTVKSLVRRKTGHCFRAKKGDRRHAFQIALLEHGFSAFQWKQIDAAETKEELDAKEKQWVAHYKPDDPAHGYNSTGGGIKTVYSPEARRKISEALKGRVITNEARRKQREKMKGRHLTAEHRRKISVALKGVKPSPETCKKMSLAQKGRIVSEETRQKMSLSARHRSKRGV